MKEFLVVQVVQNGKTKYVKEGGIFCDTPLVDHPWDARLFDNTEQNKKYSIPHLLQSFYVKGAFGGPKSGICVDSLPKVVRMRCTYEIIDGLQPF